jgi:hypothetical protein
MNNQITRRSRSNNIYSNTTNQITSRTNNTTQSQLTSRRRNNRVLWTDPQILLLIQERRRQNFEYHYLIPGRSRAGFWDEIASTINAAFATNYDGIQCMNKFNSLVSQYHVSKIYNK